MADRLDLVEALQLDRAAALSERLRDFVGPRRDERALDVGSGTGALALALAPHVREVVAVEIDPERVERARKLAGVAPVRFLVGDARHLEFPDDSFDLAGTLRTLHHVDRPDLVVAELARVTRPGGVVLVVDQLALDDPGESAELDRFERARDPTHSRALPEDELRELFSLNGLELFRAERNDEVREHAAYLDLAGCHGAARARALDLAPDPDRSRIPVGWFLLRKQAAGEGV
ncbi:MAG TPA: class I SAM-dependent methyltransferase [Gaiellaceae bacterium]|jgi:SAM-dependent methyltransferase